MHPLHTKTMLKRAGLSEFTARRTGRTTALALKAIAEAIENPRKPIPVRDHEPTDAMDRYLAEMIKGMIHALGLEQMSVQRKREGFFLTFGAPEG